METTHKTGMMAEKPSTTHELIARAVALLDRALFAAQGYDVIAHQCGQDGGTHA